MEWTREKTLALISEYRKRRGLWDMTHDDYRKKEMKQKLLMEVSACLGNNVPIPEIEKKFHTLRTQYHREINRMKRKEPYNSKWFGFKTLEFLSSPKACRSTKGRLKTDVKSNNTVTTNYIIRSAVAHQDNSASATNSDNNIAEEYVTIHRKPSTITYETAGNIAASTSRSHELEKLIEETTKDVEDIDEPKAKLTIKEITVPLEHHHNYSTQSAAASEISSVDQEGIAHHEIHQQQHHQIEEEVEELGTIDIQEEPDEITYQTTNATGATSHTTATTLQHQHHAVPTRIIKLQRRDTSDDNYYDDQQAHIHTVTAAGTKRIYYEANGQQHTATILTTPTSAPQNTTNTVLLNSANAAKLHSHIPNRNSITISQATSQTPPSIQSSPQQMRDDCSTYGEYVANEMRSITSREILVALKHKINTALFEANMAEIQK